jgi:hypothetical protein
MAKVKFLWTSGCDFEHEQNDRYDFDCRADHLCRRIQYWTTTRGTTDTAVYEVCREIPPRAAGPDAFVATLKNIWKLNDRFWP